VGEQREEGKEKKVGSNAVWRMRGGGRVGGVGPLRAVAARRAKRGAVGKRKNWLTEYYSGTREGGPQLAETGKRGRSITGGAKIKANTKERVLSRSEKSYATYQIDGASNGNSKGGRAVIRNQKEERLSFFENC